MTGTRTVAIFAAAVAMLTAGFGMRSLAHPSIEHVVHVTAKKFEYGPNEITVKRGEPVVIELASLDRKHGFQIPELGVRADVKPGETVMVRFTPDKVGRFNFHCDLFCGSGHESMAGTLIVTE